MNTQPKHARDMSPAEFDAAMKARAWRTHSAPATAALPLPPTAPSTASTATPPPPKPPAAKHAKDMTDAEFAAAMKQRAWRNL